MKLLLMDLDGTLLDSTYFKQQLFKLLAKEYGIAEDVIVKDYEANVVGIHETNWLDSFITYVASKSEKEPDLVKLKQRIFDELRVNILQLNFLRNFDGTKMIFTFGNDAFQKEKIAAVQLMRFVDDVLITQQNKIDFVDSLVQYDSLNIKGTQYDNVTIVDDDVLFLEQIQKRHPWITTFEKDSLITNAKV